MNHLILTGFLRSLARDRLYAAINIGGLAVGIAVFLILGLYVRFETNFDTWLPDYRNVYVLEEHSRAFDAMNVQLGPPLVLRETAAREIPGLSATRMIDTNATVLVNGVGQQEKMLLADPNFLDLMALPVEQGAARGALDSPSNVLITSKVARRYFGSSDPIGQVMTVAIGASRASYKVAVVLKDPPGNSSLQFGLVAQLKVPTDATDPLFQVLHDWHFEGPPPFLRIQSPEAAAELEHRLEALLRARDGAFANNIGERIDLRLRPLTAVHFAEPGSALTVTTLGLVGMLALLIAVVNYVNLATARAGLRAREIAMRKVLGADRATVFRDLLGEALMTGVIASVLGLALAEISLPFVNAMGGLSLEIRYVGAGGVLLPLALLTLLVGTCAGIYPAWVLSRWPAAAILASARAGGGGRSGSLIREVLVVFQFALATALMIGTAVLVAQTNHVRFHDIGFRRAGLLVLPSLANSDLDAAQRATLMHRLSSLPTVSGVAQSNTAPGGSGFVTSTLVPVPGVAGRGQRFQLFSGTLGFFPVVGAHLLAGRFFDARHPGDAISGTDSSADPVIINRAGVRALHFANPAAAVGRTLGGTSRRTIIGVIEDMRFDSPRVPVQPTLYEYQPRDPLKAVGLVRFTGDPRAMVAQARRLWRQTAAEVPFKAATAVEQLDQLSKADVRAARMFSLGAALAILIACVGLWGLASFNTARRTREVGIRKALGASSAQIVKLLVGQFIRPVLIANLFAWPLAFFTLRPWLAGFDDRIALSPLFFAGGAVAALGIAILTVTTQSLRAARTTPARALRHE